MDIVEHLHELAHKEPSETQKLLDKTLLEYEEKFGNTDITTVFDDDEEIIKKLKTCIELGIEYDDLYVGDLDDDCYI